MEAKNKTRLGIGALAASASLLVALASHEGYTDKAIIPVAGDRPTVGFGSTFRDDGTPVQPGDSITPVKALQRTLAHIQKDETALKRCVTAPLAQHEYDTLTDFAYQYGAVAACNSSMVRLSNAGRYAEACQAYARYKFVAGRDCSIRSNGCYGVHLRSQERVKSCLGESTK